jgi:threonyl-tRNA synthetase
MNHKIYIQSEEVGKGLPILNKTGAIAKQRLIEYISHLLLERGYIPTSSPHVGNLSLFETSGHYPYYKDSMFPIIESEAERLVLKPMNCPFHITHYKELGNVSYRDLPVKLYEFGQVYRNEDSGALNGLFRCRAFTQDDGHIFCSMMQIPEVVDECVALIKQICDRVGFSLSVKLSVRDNASQKYVGTDENWAVSEDVLKAMCIHHFEQKYETEIGGAAFYGPKIDFIAKDSLGRQWQLGTIQLDFNLPTRFNLKYINNDNSEAVPVLIHRALLGSIERFLAVLSETNIPNWLNPFNVGIVDIARNDAKNYLFILKSMLHKNAIYPTMIDHPDNLAGTIKKLHNNGISEIIIVGDKELKTNSYTVNNTNYPMDDFYGVWMKQFQL